LPPVLEMGCVEPPRVNPLQPIDESGADPPWVSESVTQNQRFLNLAHMLTFHGSQDPVRLTK
jgi:hypothetical protein